MTKEQVLDLIRQGEGQIIEFKERFPMPKVLAKEFCAFANTNDGYILLGVDDAQEVVGIKWQKADDVTIINIGSNNCSPHIIPLVDIVDINKKTVVVLTVPQGINKPYKANNVVYRRYGAVTRPADRTTEMRLMQNGGHLRFDILPVKGAVIDDLDIEKIDRYLALRASILPNETFEEKIRILRNLEYVTGVIGKLLPTNGGILCLSEFPQKFLHNAIVKCAFFKGGSKTS